VPKVHHKLGLFNYMHTVWLGAATALQCRFTGPVRSTVSTHATLFALSQLLAVVLLLLAIGRSMCVTKRSCIVLPSSCAPCLTCVVHFCTYDIK
jgi:hypothetical protein